MTFISSETHLQKKKICFSTFRKSVFSNLYFHFSENMIKTIDLKQKLLNSNSILTQNLKNNFCFLFESIIPAFHSFL
jgi:hypothetical protein